MKTAQRMPTNRLNYFCLFLPICFPGCTIDLRRSPGIMLMMSWCFDSGRLWKCLPSARLSFSIQVGTSFQEDDFPIAPVLYARKHSSILAYQWLCAWSQCLPWFSSRCTIQIGDNGKTSRWISSFLCIVRIVAFCKFSSCFIAYQGLQSVELLQSRACGNIS